MPTRPDQTPKRSAPQEARIDRAISRARLALAFERLWAALHWPLMVAGVFGGLVASGLLPGLPLWPRLGLLAVLALLFFWSLRAAAGLRWPSRREAMRRVEQATGLAHHPVLGRDDRLAPDTADPLQQIVWEEHRRRQLLGLAGLRAGRPRSAWRDIDPRALRLPVGLALAAALLLGRGDLGGNLAGSLEIASPAPAQALSLDAWLKPPAYTGKPPMLLTSPAMAARLKAEPELHVPEKSTLSLRLSGARSPQLSFEAPGGGEAPAPAVKGFAPQVTSGDGLFQADVALVRPATVVVADGGRELARWHISLIPDAPPTIEITGDPQGDPSGMLSARWTAADDYGVAGITADIYLADTQDEGVGFADAGVFEFDPPKLTVNLRKANPREETGEARADVAQHPWAGLMVEMTLTARDAAGNRTESAKRVFRLPERQFTKPLARALIEQRKRLILTPEEAGGVEQMLDAILTYPKGLIETSGTHLAIATAMARLRGAEDRAAVDGVIRMLWEIAVNIEDGASADARAELQALRKELQRALREGAPPERIAELTKKLREALERYLQSMMEEALKRQQQGQAQDRQSGQEQGRTVTPQDLQKMLDMIDKLAQSGANQAAEEMLSELDDILRNLKPGNPQQGQGQDGPLGQMLDKLSDLMRQQQRLMDDTQRMQPGGPGEEQQGQQGQDGQPGSQGRQDGLGDRQQGLGRMLEELMRRFGETGMEAPRAFGEAGKNMEGAERSLRQGDRQQALGNQGEALSRLREGARGLARQMLQQSQGEQGRQGRDGEARGDDRDPLGRPLPSHGEDTGPDRNMLPSERAMQRAREILDMLRARAGEQGLPPIERDYIDRLLRGLY